MAWSLGFQAFLASFLRASSRKRCCALFLSAGFSASESLAFSLHLVLVALRAERVYFCSPKEAVWRSVGHLIQV